MPSSLLVGGVLGIIVSIIASRAPQQVPLAGPPLDTAGNIPSKHWYIPFVGARRDEDGAIDWPNFGSQAGAALVTGIALFVHGFSFGALEAIVLSAILLTILRIDWQHHLIFMLTIWPGIFIALGFSIVDSWSDFLSSLIAGALAAGVFLLFYLLALFIYKRRALGFGDVFLAGLIGTMVGLQFVLITLFLGMFVAAIGGLFLVLIRVRGRKDYIPYGAYLSFAAIVMVLFYAS
ncbi:MAG: prepilin peptidase [Chloroflexota bacterium]